MLAKRYGFKVYSSLGTLNALRAGNKLDPNTDADVITDEVVIGNMRVQRIDTPTMRRKAVVIVLLLPTENPHL